MEANELEDFEILEGFADDNASFMSNMSAVERKLHHEKVQRNTILHSFKYMYIGAKVATATFATVPTVNLKPVTFGTVLTLNIEPNL